MSGACGSRDDVEHIPELEVRHLRHGLPRAHTSIGPSLRVDRQIGTSDHVTYAYGPARLRFFEQALERVRHVPGVLSAGFTSQLPKTFRCMAY